MARKKSIKKAADAFCDKAEKIAAFGRTAYARKLGDEYISWMYEYALIRLYREFESLVFDALVGAINNDTTTLSRSIGFSFPKHLTEEVCRFLVTGTGYFDFKGRDGLIQTLKKFVPSNHYLVDVIKKPKYRDSLEKLTALRNFAAHNSEHSNKAALKATGQKKLGSAAHG